MDSEVSIMKRMILDYVRSVVDAGKQLGVPVDRNFEEQIEHSDAYSVNIHLFMEQALSHWADFQDVVRSNTSVDKSTSVKSFLPRVKFWEDSDEDMASKPSPAAKLQNKVDSAFLSATETNLTRMDRFVNSESNFNKSFQYQDSFETQTSTSHSCGRDVLDRKQPEKKVGYNKADIPYCTSKKSNNNNSGELKGGKQNRFDSNRRQSFNSMNGDEAATAPISPYEPLSRPLDTNNRPPPKGSFPCGGLTLQKVGKDQFGQGQPSVQGQLQSHSWETGMEQTGNTCFGFENSNNGAQQDEFSQAGGRTSRGERFTQNMQVQHPKSCGGSKNYGGPNSNSNRFSRFNSNDGQSNEDHNRSESYPGSGRRGRGGRFNGGRGAMVRGGWAINNSNSFSSSYAGDDTSAYYDCSNYGGYNVNSNLISSYSDGNSTSGGTESRAPGSGTFQSGGGSKKWQNSGNKNAASSWQDSAGLYQFQANTIFKQNPPAWQLNQMSQSLTTQNDQFHGGFSQTTADPRLKQKQQESPFNISAKMSFSVPETASAIRRRSAWDSPTQEEEETSMKHQPQPPAPPSAVVQRVSIGSNQAKTGESYEQDCSFSKNGGWLNSSAQSAWKSGQQEQQRGGPGGCLHQVYGEHVPPTTAPVDRFGRPRQLTTEIRKPTSHAAAVQMPRQESPHQAQALSSNWVQQQRGPPGYNASITPWAPSTCQKNSGWDSSPESSPKHNEAQQHCRTTNSNRIPNIPFPATVTQQRLQEKRGFERFSVAPPQKMAPPIHQVVSPMLNVEERKILTKPVVAVPTASSKQPTRFATSPEKMGGVLEAQKTTSCKVVQQMKQNPFDAVKTAAKAPEKTTSLVKTVLAAQNKEKQLQQKPILEPSSADKSDYAKVIPTPEQHAPTAQHSKQSIVKQHLTTLHSSPSPEREEPMPDVTIVNVGNNEKTEDTTSSDEKLVIDVARSSGEKQQHKQEIKKSRAEEINTSQRSKVAAKEQSEDTTLPPKDSRNTAVTFGFDKEEQEEEQIDITTVEGYEENDTTEGHSITSSPGKSNFAVISSRPRAKRAAAFDSSYEEENEDRNSEEEEQPPPKTKKAKATKRLDAKAAVKKTVSQKQAQLDRKASSKKTKNEIVAAEQLRWKELKVCVPGKSNAALKKLRAKPGATTESVDFPEKSKSDVVHKIKPVLKSGKKEKPV